MKIVNASDTGDFFLNGLLIKFAPYLWQSIQTRDVIKRVQVWFLWCWEFIVIFTSDYVSMPVFLYVFQKFFVSCIRVSKVLFLLYMCVESLLSLLYVCRKFFVSCIGVSKVLYLLYMCVESCLSLVYVCRKYFVSCRCVSKVLSLFYMCVESCLSLLYVYRFAHLFLYSFIEHHWASVKRSPL